MESRWKRVDERPRCQKFECPHCGKICYCSILKTVGVTSCDYSYCPYCGMPVIPDKESDKK